MKRSDRYLKIVEWSPEDECYVGTCPGLMLGGVHGDDEAAVYAELCDVVREWMRIYEEDGEPLPAPTAGREYSGRFVLRAGRELHKELATRAMRLGESLNTYCVKALEARVHEALTPRRARVVRHRSVVPQGAGGRGTRLGDVGSEVTERDPAGVELQGRSGHAGKTETCAQRDR
ncbi:toxin-antitoxin system HicB family antitoxin [Candidatus Fermentibacteria bacterium]|nr:toxin-antitoxin system HicB family antitoxin [Candidatus Fermentibacteria bacterium]